MLISKVNIKFNNINLYDNFNIEFEDEKINCIIGKSGCGKTTLLNYISDELVENKNNIGYVFQEDSLIPWKNIYSNLEFIAQQYIDKEQITSEIDEVLEYVGLIEEKFRYPNELSSGMRQRINIARVLLGKYDVIIMDEPLKSLDIDSRNKIISKIKEINNNNRTTIILVTHDILEAELLADNIFLLYGCPVKKKIFKDRNEVNNILNKFKKGIDQLI